jgi:hypothetical protein
VTATLDNAPGDGGAPPKSGEDVMIDPVVGSRRFSNYLCAHSLSLARHALSALRCAHA